jgi:diguanylate cyclase (GGDEF)-like protein
MDRKPLSDYSKIIIIGLGILATGLALFTLPGHAFSRGYILLLAFTILVAPRMSLALPRSKFALTFSDSIIFLAYLIYGGETAILTAFIGDFANCVYLKKRGTFEGRWVVLFNSSLAALVTAVSYGALVLFSGFVNIDPNSASTRALVAVLGLFSLTHFFASTIAVSVYHNIKTGNNIWKIWKNQCLSSSLTQFMGAGLAGIVYAIINYGDLVITGIAVVGLSLIYLSYRQSIKDINEAINQAEEAERQRAETERARRKEAEKNAAQLEILLEKEEKTNAALRKSESSLIHAALHDSLTKLPNRKQFGDMLRECIEKYKEDASNTFHIMFLDIRKFKNINDSLGHTVGDKVLTIAAKRFKKMVKSTDMVARIGGDEFAVILTGLSTTGKAQKVARRIFDTISQPFSLGGNSISISINIGVAPCDEEYNKPEEVLRDADIAMHYAKEKNSGVAVFTKELRVRFLERVRFENDLRHAIDRNELTMNYQPLVVLADGTLLGFEALLRWHHSELGLIPPNKFIPIAEESGLIIPITKWILEETTKQIATWQKIGPATKNLIMSVNVSGKHLSKDELIDDVENALHISKISPASLKLEITESAAMENAEHTISVLNRLKNLGVQISIDDFGTGYSSFSYLHRLPFDTLKIDRSFVYNVGENGENSEILQSIISLAKNLRKKVIAEGIETESQLALLQNLGCDYGQGYVMARPMIKDKIEQALYEGRNWLPTKRIERDWPVAVVAEEENLPVF